jgi:hypothetical protein
MKQISGYLSILLLGFTIQSCLTAGTHGSIKAYQFNVSKTILQKEVEDVIAFDPNLSIDSSRNYIIDVTNNKNDTIWDNHLNDGNRYVTISVKVPSSDSNGYKYIFQYTGTNIDWDTSKTSEISIVYAFNEKGHGGSNENGGLSGDFGSLKNKLIDVFTKSFVLKVDSVLGNRHLEND